MKDSYEEYEASEDQPAMTFKIQDGKEFEHTFGDTTEEHELNEDQPAVGFKVQGVWTYICGYHRTRLSRGTRVAS